MFIWETKTSSTPGFYQIGNKKVYCHPLLNVSPPQQEPLPPSKDDILVFTSKNGVKAFCELTEQRDWPVLCVGETTAEWARASGFKDVQSAMGNVDGLLDMIESQSSLNSRRLYYASGREVSGDLAGRLKQKGYNVTRSVLYETHPNIDVPEIICAAISTESPFIVTLFSAKGAQVFSGLNLNFNRIETISISENVDHHLDGLGLRRRKIAKFPNEDSMIKLLP